MKKKILSMFIVCIVAVLPINTIEVTATQNRSYNFSKNYTLTGNYANDIVNVANAQLGKTKTNLGYTEAWCANFATDCARLTGVPDNVVPYNYSARGACVSLYNYMLNNCNAQVVSSRQAGDFVFYYCPTCGTYPHVGIVIDGTYSIEGNVNGQVYKIGGNNGQYVDSQGHKVSSGQIQRIYVRPQYGGGTSTSTTPSDIGTNIYIYILNKPTNKPIACVEGGTNVVLDTDKWIARQRWFATRNSDGSYYFMNAANNKYLTVSGSNVQVGDSKTKWFIYNNGSSWLIQHAGSEKVLDLSNAGTTDGTNVQVYTKNDSDAQAFTYFICNPTAGKPAIKKSADYIKESGLVTISWDKTDYTKEYKYYLAEYPVGFAYSTNTKSGSTQNNSITFNNLTSGEYTCFIHAVSHKGEEGSQSNWVTFKVYADDYIPTKTVVSNNHIYALYDYEMSWSFARDLCKDLGGNLVTVTSAVENAVIEDLMQSGKKDAYWLGATDIDGNDKDFKWVTGETFSYSNWMSGEPSSGGTDGEKEHFIEVRKSYGNKWNDVNNISKKNKGFILEVDLSEVSPTAEGSFKGNKYLLFDKNTTWTEAREICKQYDGHMATIESTDENTFIKNFLKGGKRGWYYLGGQKENNSWKWLDGTDINTVIWNDSAPDWNGTNLMMYRSDGSCVGLCNSYYPEKDIDKIGFVCEIEGTKETPEPTPKPSAKPTPKPTPAPTPIQKCFTVNYGDGYADITNTSGEAKTVSVIEADYSDNTFVDLKSRRMTFDAGEKRTMIINSSTKIFVWDSLEGMRSLTR